MTPSTTSASQKPSSVTLRHLKKTEEIIFTAGLGEHAPKFFTALRAQLVHSADDVMAITNFLRFIEASFNPTTILRDLTDHAVLLETLLTIFGTSQFFSEILIRDPELFRWLTATDVLESSKTKETFLTTAQQSTEAFQSPSRKLNVLKRFQRREMLRIGVRDILRLADLETTTRELSHLADAVIEVVAGMTWHELEEQHGDAPKTSWTIVGLGKLGGEELNYSSDIDLIAVFDDDREGSVGQAKMTTGEFFVRFIERVVQRLSESTEEGHFYRVDMRLRPDGKSGALIRSFGSTMMYYESRGELWERQMLIKARYVSGDTTFAQKFLSALSPFIYPRTFFENPREEIAQIKGRIEKQYDALNIKLRPGGIRDVEFIIQALQLVNGGKNPILRSANTLTALGLLQSAGLLSADESQQLREAYIFFRTAEHRLQMLEYTQTHTLPKATADLRKLAARMGLPHKDFEKLLRNHFQHVRTIFDNVFTQKETSYRSTLERFLSEPSDSKFSRSFARRHKLRDSEKASRTLRRMMYGTHLLGKKEYTERTRTLFKNIAEPLLDEIARSVAPDKALAHAERIFSALHSQDALYTMCAEKEFRRAFVDICARSAMLTKQFAVSPGLAETTLTGIASILRDGTIALPHGASLHRWKMEEETKAAVRHILNVTDEKELFHSLSNIASQTLAFLYEAERKKLRLPKSARFCIIGMGKLGGDEINFGSDLDVLFLFEAQKGAEKCEELAARIITACSQTTPDGKLYDIDARLRPEGRNAPLAVADKQYLEYLQHRASLWERQSLTRARYIAGDAAFCAAVMKEVHHCIYTSPLPKNWTEEIDSMRHRTESRSRTSSSDFFDVKLGAGGMMDAEFAVQALQLARGKRAVPSTNMFDLLKAYSRGSSGIADLRKNYRFFRQVETALRLGLDVKSSVIPADDESLDYLARLTGFPEGKKFLTALRARMKETRSLYTSTLRSLA